MTVSEWVLKGKKGKSKLHPYSMKLKEWTACSLAHKQLWCGYKSESKTGLPTVLSQNCLTLNLPTKNFPKETLISSTGLQGIKLLSSAPNPPFCILPFYLELCRYSSFANCLPVRLYQQGFLEGDRLAKEIIVLCLLSKSRHFTMAVGVVLVSSIFPTQLHPPIASLHSRDAIGTWPGPSQATPRDLNPNLQGPSCELLIATSSFAYPCHPRAYSSSCNHSLCFFNIPILFFQFSHTFCPL